jgi:hypothetical protein
MTMACCGGARQQLRTEYSVGGVRSPKPVNGRVILEYTGPDSLVVRGAVTGRGYAFAGYGAQVSVDARDAASLLATPYLQRVLR